MVEQSGGVLLEFGRVLATTWEHQWATSDSGARSPLSLSKRILPPEKTSYIYSALENEEAALIRGSLPFPPFDFRVRLVTGGPESHRDVFDDCVDRVRALSDLVPGWADVLRETEGKLDIELTHKAGRQGSITVPDGDTPRYWAYSVEWHTIIPDFPIDTLFKKLSPRYIEPSHRLFPSFDEIEALRRNTAELR